MSTTQSQPSRTSRYVMSALTAAVAAASPGCALLDPTAYGLVYAGNIRAAEGEVSRGDGLQQGRWRYTGDGDQVLSEGEYIDDVRTGPWADYYGNGNPKYLYTLRDSSRHGLFQSFHPNAKLETSGQFVAGYQFGNWNFFDRAGRLVETGGFLNDHREGRWTKYFPNGNVKLVELHHDGDPVGHWQVMDEAGQSTDIWNPMPEGMEWAVERWADNGPVRREGFLSNGNPIGLWKSFHRDGSLRAIGSFEDGRPSGPWQFYNRDADLIASGNVDRGRPTGQWDINTDGNSRTVDGGTTFRGGMPAAGEWSDASLDRTESVGAVVNTWLGEVRSAVDSQSLVAQEAPSPAEAEAPLAPEVAEVLLEAAVEPPVPVPAHAFTQKEQKVYQSLVSYYGGAKDAFEELQSVYRGTTSRTKENEAVAAFPELGGNRAKALEFVGKELPMTLLRSADGTVFDLKKQGGQKIVLVLLRGFDGEICPYCVAQTQALCEAGALEEFDDRGVALEVVFPGSKLGLDAFQEQYRTLQRSSREAYGMRYANAYDVATKFDIEGEKVIPTTLILDERGIVQFAYVGTTVEDRPTLPLLLEEIDRMDRE